MTADPRYTVAQYGDGLYYALIDRTGSDGITVRVRENRGYYHPDAARAHAEWLLRDEGDG